MLSRRLVLAGFLSAGALPACARQARSLTVYKTATCPCCDGWIEHIRRAGFEPAVEVLPELSGVRARLGVPDEAASCHTGMVGGYAVEGHVPAQDVLRLLSERPRARGIAVPGMPLGSPGMETRDGRRETYATLLIGLDGALSVFARH